MTSAISHPARVFDEEQRNTLLFFHGTHSHTRGDKRSWQTQSDSSVISEVSYVPALFGVLTNTGEATTCLLAWNVVEISVGAILFELLLLCELLTPRRAVFPTVAFPLCFTQWNLESKENVETRNGCYF